MNTEDQVEIVFPKWNDYYIDNKGHTEDYNRTITREDLENMTELAANKKYQELVTKYNVRSISNSKTGIHNYIEFFRCLHHSKVFRFFYKKLVHDDKFYVLTGLNPNDFSVDIKMMIIKQVGKILKKGNYIDAIAEWFKMYF